jgi:hypothetical protein
MSETRSIASMLTISAPKTATSASRFCGGVLPVDTPAGACNVIAGRSRAETASPPLR